MLRRVSALLLCCPVLLGAGTRVAPPPIVAPAGSAPRELYDNSAVRFLTTSPAWSLAEVEEAPGYKTPLHRHREWDESFYVLSGVLTVFVAGKSHDLAAGSFVSIPRGTPHGQANFFDRPVKFLIDMKPGGFEGHLRDRVALARTTKPGDPDFPAKMDAIRRKNVDLIEMLGTWER